jgi:subtilisin-like proprotein convertase family protein
VVGERGSNSVIRLLGSDGTTAIERDDNDGRLNGSSGIAGARIPTSGTYYLEVSSKLTQTIRPYDLWLDVRSGSPVQEAEPNDTEDTATPIGDGVVSGTNAGGEYDYYALQLDAGDSVFLSLDERDSSANSDGRVGFGASNRERHFTSPGSNDSIESSVYLDTVPTAGTYYAYVGGAAGTYRLSVTVVKAVKRSCRTYTITPADGGIPDKGHATFPIDVPDAGGIDHVALALDVSHPLMLDLDATLQAPGGSEIPIFTDVGDNVAGRYPRMQALFDDDAALPPFGIDLTSTAMQPERDARMTYFAGRQAAGTWNLRFEDDGLGDAGSLTRADLILCARPPEKPQDTVFSASFEGGDDGFTHSGTADEWERGTPSTPQDATSPASRTARAGRAASRPTSTPATTARARRTSSRRRSRWRAAAARSSRRGRCGTRWSEISSITRRCPSRRTAARTRGGCSRGTGGPWPSPSGIRCGRSPTAPAGPFTARTSPTTQARRSACGSTWTPT